MSGLISREDAPGSIEENAPKVEPPSVFCRKEKRKATKKLKRKQTRKEIALNERAEEEALLNDPEEQLRTRLEEQEETEILERERKAFEEREKLWIESAKKAEEESQQRKLLEKEEELRRKQFEHENELNEDDAWEYVEEGPAEIIWQGDEITVKKKRVRVPKKNVGQQPTKEDIDRPTSNPLPPQSEAFADYKSSSALSTQQVFDNVAQQIPNFGTEQDKAHCPFHIKTGACRFGSRCSRVHFYPDKSCTLLIKNMYNGPGLAWEQDEGLEIRNSHQGSLQWRFMVMGLVDGDRSFNNSHTDEEVECCYEEFYEDVHTEFLKFGEIVNFKVCKNGSSHLRGNVYVHYMSLESALLAYQSINGRYFAGKQITCEFVGVTRWKVAICGEYMKSKLKTCSRGTACNFIHCFRNPGGDYEWADSDNPPPRYWVKKMVALFGTSDESSRYYERFERESWGHSRNSSRKLTPKYHSGRSRASERRQRSFLNAEEGQCEGNSNLDDQWRNRKNIAHDHHDDASDRDYSDRDRHRDQHRSRSRTSSRCLKTAKEFPESLNRSHCQDSGTKYSDLHTVRDRRQPSRKEECRKSDENYESDSPGRYDGRRKSQDDSGHYYYGESLDEAHSWESETSSLEEHPKSRRKYSSSRTDPNRREKKTDSSDGYGEFEENRKRYRAKHRTGKKPRKQQDSDGCLSSEESKVKMDGDSKKRLRRQSPALQYSRV